MTKHAHLILAPTALLAVIALVGCGAKEKSTSAAADAAPAQAAPAPAPAPAPVVPKTVTGTLGNAEAGKAVYLRVCFACHQPTGLGLPGVFPPLAGSDQVTGDPRRIIRIVLHGLQGPIQVKGVTYNSVMPPQGLQLKDQEIADVLTYVRSAFGNNAGAVTVEEVAKIRESDKARTAMWTWAELNAP